MYPFVVADIGGTNARFALVSGKTEGTDEVPEAFVIEQIQILKGADFSSFEHAMSAYLDMLDDVTVQAACVAIAGPVQGDRVSMTNLPWSFSQETLKKKFNLRAFEAINDYTAQALATSQIDDTGLATVVTGERVANANKAILGPGSGLGVAGLVHTVEAWVPVPSEGGHVNMAPSNELELAMFSYLIKKHGYLSAEMCLSGPGLENLYDAVCHLEGVPAQAHRAAAISSLALTRRDEQCHTALSVFCALLGTMAGNLVLTYGATGGAYITGGIVPRFVDFLRESEFEQRFKNKGVMSHYLENVPVDVVVHEQPAFLGAAAWMNQSLR